MILCKVHFRRGVYFIFRSQQKNLSGEHPVKVQEKPIKQIGVYFMFTHLCGLDLRQRKYRLTKGRNTNWIPIYFCAFIKYFLLCKNVNISLISTAYHKYKINDIIKTIGCRDVRGLTNLCFLLNAWRAFEFVWSLGEPHQAQKTKWFCKKKEFVEKE